MTDQSWTLFMDRDGVVNEQIVGGYVQNASQFIFIDHFLEAMRILRPKFNHIFIVSNQQGIGKRICKKEQIDEIHNELQTLLQEEGAPFDKIYYCPHLASEHCGCRKPAIGMALQAKKEFPDIDFSKAIMVGDSLSDMQFGHNAKLINVHVGAIRYPEFDKILSLTKYHFASLYDFAKMFQ